jgi:pSer/pThr/pTyr-binding forkhead associated (FHA) protein
MNLTNCPYCKEQIEIDSIYCDQCGSALMFCSSCNELRKGKRCSACGNELVKPGTVEITTNKPSANNNQANNYQANNNPVNINPAIQTPSPIDNNATVREVQPQKVVTKLVCRESNIELQLLQGAIIGRKNGPYTDLLSSQGYISGTHARLEFNNASSTWMIVDLNSTNGTFVNGEKISPDQPIKFNIGDKIKIATLVFDAV